MTSAEYLNDLRKRLRTLPRKEADEALSYYEEYFAEAGPEGEAELINRLGTPAEVAAAIISDYAMKDIHNEGEQKSNKGAFKTMWIVIIAVLASPIAIPLAIVLIAVAIAFIISIFSFYLSLFIAALAMVVVGIVATGVGFVGIFTAPIEGITLLGGALVCLSLGMALGIGTIKLCQLTVKGITWIFAKLLGRKGGQQ